MRRTCRCQTIVIVLLAGPGLMASLCRAEGEDPDERSTLDWVEQALVVAMPAAAVGGCQAGVYTPAENGVRPWRNAIIRWLTSRSVRGNGSVLVRQEGGAGGAGLTAIVDPRAEYVFEVLAYLPGKGGGFGTPQEDTDTQIVATVMDRSDRVLAEAPIALISSGWAPGRVEFASGDARESALHCPSQVTQTASVPLFRRRLSLDA